MVLRPERSGVWDNVCRYRRRRLFVPIHRLWDAQAIRLQSDYDQSRSRLLGIGRYQSIASQETYPVCFWRWKTKGEMGRTVQIFVIEAYVCVGYYHPLDRFGQLYPFLVDPK